MTFIVDIPPTEEPVSLAELKLRLRIDHGHDDALIARLIRAARLHIEGAHGLALVTRTLTSYAKPPSHGRMNLRPWPVEEVLAVSVLQAGETQMLDPAAYEVDLQVRPCRLKLNWGSLLMPTEDVTIAVQMTAGFGGAEDVPADLVEAVLQLAAEWYAPGEGLAPDAVARMLSPYREARL